MTLVISGAIRIAGLRPLRAKAASGNYSAFLYRGDGSLSFTLGLVPALRLVSALIGWLGCHDGAPMHRFVIHDVKHVFGLDRGNGTAS
jgi:hypothetical protein